VCDHLFAVHRTVACPVSVEVLCPVIDQCTIAAVFLGAAKGGWLNDAYFGILVPETKCFAFANWRLSTPLLLRDENKRDMIFQVTRVGIARPTSTNALRVLAIMERAWTASTGALLLLIK